MQTATSQVKKFELTVKLRDGGKRSYDYERDGEDIDGKVKYRDNAGKRTKQVDQAGIDASERLLTELAPRPGMSESELLQRSCEALRLSRDDIKSLEVELEFADGSELEAEQGD